MQLATLQTLADPSRFQIVEALLEGEQAVNDLVAKMDIHQSGVSRHLRILEDAGFVRMRPDGPRRLYSLRPEPFRELNAWVSQYRALWEGRLDAFAAALERKQQRVRAHVALGGAMTEQERKRITFERVYRADVQDVWDLWTTKSGIESWWGPGGFAVTVRKLDFRPGGELLYAMTAIDPPQVEFMKKAGMPVTHEYRITFSEIVPRRRLAYVHLADFIPGVDPYDVATVVELHETAEGVRMVLTFDAMHSDEWTRMATMGWESELGKLAAVLEAGVTPGRP